MLKSTIVLLVMACAIRCAAGENFVENVNFSPDGLGGALGWDMAYGADNGIERRGPDGPDGSRVLALKFRTQEYMSQKGITLKGGEPYEFGAWVRTSGLKEKMHMAIWNFGWWKQQDTACFPSDTQGQWKRISWTGKLFDSSNGTYSFAFVGKMNPGASVEVSAPFIWAKSAKGEAGGKRSAVPERLTSRVVPVNPLLAEVSAQTGEMTFHFSGDLPDSPVKCEYAATIDGKRWVAGPMNDRRLGTIAFGKTPVGDYRLTVGVRMKGASSFIKTNCYPVTFCIAPQGPSGRKLNNLVTELLRTSDLSGPVRVFNPRRGWVYVGFSTPQRSAYVRLAGQYAPIIRPRPGTRTETMRFLDAGWRELSVTGTSSGAELVVRAVPRIVNSRPSTEMKPSDLGAWKWNADFSERYMLSFCNTGSWYGRRRGGERNDLENAYYAERGLHIEAMVTLPCGDPDRNDPDKCRRRLGGSRCYRDGFDITVDESGVNGAPRAAKVNYGEAVWDLVNEPNAVNTFYCDAPAEIFTDWQTQVSEIAATVNSGRGTGMIYPEVYPAALADYADAHHWEDHFIRFRASVTNMVPAAGRNILYYFGTWLEPTSWTDWSCPEADIRVLYSDFLRRIAVDPGYGDVGGVAAGFFDYTDDDVVRWLSRAVRYYAVEGGTNDLAAAYGFKYLPGHVVNPDFARQFEGWTAIPAKEGSLCPYRVKDYGGRKGQCRQKVKPGVGDDVAMFIRSGERPNRLSQRLTGLVPGKCYSVEFITADLDDVLAPWSVDESFSVRASVSDGGTVIPELGYEHKAPRNRAELRARGHKIALKTLHRLIFRADRTDAVLAFSDWRTEERPDAPVGRKTILNWINVRQYYIESDEELEWLKARANRDRCRDGADIL